MHLQTNKPLPFPQPYCGVVKEIQKHILKVFFGRSMYVCVYAIHGKENKHHIVMYQSRFVYCFNINQDNVSNAFRLRIFFCDWI